MLEYLSKVKFPANPGTTQTAVSTSTAATGKASKAANTKKHQDTKPRLVDLHGNAGQQSPQPTAIPVSSFNNVQFKFFN